MRLIALFLLFAPVLAAHPLDDQAQMTSEVVLVSDQRLELVLDFRYVSVIASYSEFSGNLTSPGLDANGDGYVTREEVWQRFNLLVDEFAFSFGVSINGQRVKLTPEFDRFVFRDLEREGDIDLSSPYSIHSARIHYRFVFSWHAPEPLPAGDHRVEYFFSGMQSVVHTPAQQMIAFDARVQPRRRLTDTSYDLAMEAYPRLIFNWTVSHPPPTQVAVTASDPPTDAPPTGLGELPAWLTLVAGVALALAGLATAARRAFVPGGEGRSLKPFLTSLLYVFAGAAIVLAAMMRLDLLSG
jgi:hypothetical protein